jgi:acetoin utilization deacetylase AcuC-like enzyme
LATGFNYDPRYLEHDTGTGHPESPQRLVVTMRYLSELPWFTDLNTVHARPIDSEWLHTIHTADYIARADGACERDMPYLDVPDVAISHQSCSVARLAAGSALALADAVASGEVDNGFALLRPPGHHAESGMALGFCLFNNIALTARYLQRQHGLDKIAIVDWDVHHGNGTQHSFESDPSVLYISLHQFPYYPGTGAANETGIGAGSGSVLNCPMPAASDDDDYRQAFVDRVLPKLDAFKPEAILISAGFDAHREDPMAQMALSTEFFGWMTERVMEQADRFAKGRIISLLEGGYSLRALPLCVAEHLRVLAGVAVDSEN